MAERSPEFMGSAATEYLWKKIFRDGGYEHTENKLILAESV